MNVTIYTDGAARGNPGPGGYGAVLEYIDTKNQLHVKELSAGYRRTTNNRMELLGVITAVDAFNKNWVNSWVSKNWKRGKNEPVKNVDLWKRLLEAKAPHTVKFVWVKGHAGNPQNERCDALATYAADNGPLLEDTGAEL